ncbi:MAG: MFS transporter [Spirochaetales bacterium]|jgi:Na+/melibiose symporter-like transporter|nr:MFS transporter [Spirochaetales bacterium]
MAEAVTTMEKQAGSKSESRRMLIGYTSTQMGAGVWKSYFSTYIAMLYTDIFYFPVILSGILELLSQFLNWLGGPIFGTIVDRVTFKKGKYWPWIAMGCVGVAAMYVIIFGIPTFVADPSGLAVVVFILASVRAVAMPMCDVTLVSVYPKIAKTPQERSNLAAGKSFGLRMGQTFGGWLTPVILAYFVATMGERRGWFSTAGVLSVIGVAFYLVFVFILRKSSVEADAIGEKNAIKQRKKVPFAIVLKSLFTNKALLAMFFFLVIHKFYYFLQTYTGPYFYRYYVQDLRLLGIFTTVKQLTQIGGVMLGAISLRWLKDSKRAFVISGIGHIAFLGISALFVGSTYGFIFVSGLHAFFAGMMEAFILPFFAAACDFGTWKTGAKADGLNMSIYTLAMSIASATSIAARSVMLNAIGYDARAYDVAKGILPPESVLTFFANLQALYPFVLSIVCVLIVWFFFPLNDNKLKDIREELKHREATA